MRSSKGLLLKLDLKPTSTGLGGLVAAIQPTHDRDAGLSGIFMGAAGFEGLGFNVQASMQCVVLLRLVRVMGSVAPQPLCQCDVRRRLQASW